MSAESARRAEREVEIRRLEPLVEQLAGRYNVPGHDADDVRQLAWLGIVQAFDHWDRRRPFAPFAATCARRRVFEAIRSSHALHRQGELSAIAVVRGADGVERPIADELPAPIGLEERREGRERLRAVTGALAALSPSERQSLAGHLSGVSYADRGHVTAKAADNAMQRARRKLAAALELLDAA